MPGAVQDEVYGVEAIDSLLIQLVPFFCILIDGKKSWDDAVSNWYLTSQWAAAWTLLSLEGIRRGNRGGRAAGKLKSPATLRSYQTGLIRCFTRPRTGLVGCIWQVLTYTATAPLYLIMHLLTSPVAGASSAGSSADAIIANAADIDLVPVCVVLGLIIPSVLIGLPAPDVVSVCDPLRLDRLLADLSPFPKRHLLHPEVRSPLPWQESGA